MDHQWLSDFLRDKWRSNFYLTQILFSSIILSICTSRICFSIALFNFFNKSFFALFSSTECRTSSIVLSWVFILPTKGDPGVMYESWYFTKIYSKISAVKSNWSIFRNVPEMSSRLGNLSGISNLFFLATMRWNAIINSKMLNFPSSKLINFWVVK